MAAAVSSPWGKPGTWALDAEEHEEELQRQQQTSSKNSSVDLSGEFPSLAAAAKTKTKKKKGQTISLAEFTAYGSAKPAPPPPPPQNDRLTPDELMSLPTGPRQRSAEELERSKLGGGFRSYGSGSRYGDESSNQRWGSSSSRVSEDGGRRGGGFNRESGRDFAPSRADEIDNWAAAKKPIVGNGFERRERGGFFESQSKADEVDNWAANKHSEPRRFSSTNGGGGRFEKRGSFDSLSRSRDSSFSSGPDSDSWGRRREEIGAGASGGSRPRLVLQPRTLPVTNGKADSPVAAEKPKGNNPFGNARPREEVLAEKGKDWKEIDEKLESVKMKDVTPEKGGKRGFGLGNGRVDDRAERTWRKSPEKIQDGAVEQKEEATEETEEDTEEQK